MVDIQLVVVRLVVDPKQIQGLKTLMALEMAVAVGGLKIISLTKLVMAVLVEMVVAVVVAGLQGLTPAILVLAVLAVMACAVSSLGKD